MDLTSRDRDHDSQAAEDDNKALICFGGPGLHQARFVCTLATIFRKRQTRRKAGTQSHGSKTVKAVMTARPPETRPFSSRADLSAFVEQETSMTLKNPMTRTTLNATLLLAILLSLFFQPIPVRAGGINDQA